MVRKQILCIKKTKIPIAFIPDEGLVPYTMASFYIIQSGENAKVETTFVPSLELEGSYEMALHSLETYYSFPNVD